MHAHEASAHVELAAQVGTGCGGEGKMSADNQQMLVEQMGQVLTHLPFLEDTT